MWYAKRRYGEHTVMQHTLDTIHVAEALMEAKGYFLRLRPAAREALAILVGLHDIGKVSQEFQADLGYSSPVRVNKLYHTALTFHLLAENADLISSAFGITSTRTLMVLMGAVAGHHGFPVERPDRYKADQHCGAPALREARRLICDCLSVFPGASLAGFDVKDARRISYQLSGLTSQSDWISSSADLFSYGRPVEEISAYRVVSRLSAREAIATLGFLPTRVAIYPGSAAFTGGRALRPMQVAAGGAELGPNLYLIEDQTGSGKTEAALDLSARLISAGFARGLYFALPTMALADESGKRIRDLAHLFFANPTLQIVHRNAHLSVTDETEAGAPEAHALIAGPHSLEWVSRAIADKRLADVARKSLFADIGVGTIDQAMLSVMPSRFFALRQHALADKVLVIDEAHEADSYMHEIIAQLLWLRGWLGLPTIVMSATLPAAYRDRFIASWKQGAGQADGASHTGNASQMRNAAGGPAGLTGGDPYDFPLMTTVTAGQVRHQAVAAFDTERVLPFTAVHGMADCRAILIEAGGRGLNAVWIRNSVDEAISAAEALRAEGIEVTLLHSRFAPPDRARIEAQLKASLGKEATPEARKSGPRIVVATQVIEAGLDLDFDVMISDLAPMSSLLQRAGRWRRFGGPGRGESFAGGGLYVLMPQLDEVAPGDWLEATLGRGRHVYPQDALWRTAELIGRHGAVRPHLETRQLVEASLDTSSVPGWISDASERHRRETSGNTLKGQQSALLSMRSGYAACCGAIRSEAWTPTRLGTPQVVLTLWRQTDAGPELLYGTEEGSQVKAPLSMTGLDEAPVEAVDVTLAETRSGFAGYLKGVPVRYSPACGIFFPREKEEKNSGELPTSKIGSIDIG